MCSIGNPCGSPENTKVLHPQNVAHTESLLVVLVPIVKCWFPHLNIPPLTGISESAQAHNQPGA